MHGRIKVRTTEEEKERKKKEQTLKMRAYRAAMTRIQAKRREKEYDDELLQLTAQVLHRNPDVATLWNVRREHLEFKAKELLDNQEALNTLYERELTLTEQCLMVSPKSYYAWHQRCWILERFPNANWDGEVKLCNKYLKMDERNFHTWDYRRYVAAKAKVSAEEELNFCTEKIKVNFSNYSSWHQRSLLLPILYPYEGTALPKCPMSEAKLKEELEMVLSAAFTDPNDSSAWFYQRWLLGYSRSELDVCAFRCDGKKAMLAFTKPMPNGDLKVRICDEAGEVLIELNKWSSITQQPTDTIWLSEVPSTKVTQTPWSAANQIEVKTSTSISKTVPISRRAQILYWFQPPLRSVAFSASLIAELQTQLENCNSLLEIEPDNKWTLLTSALLMRAIDVEQHHDKSLEYLRKLETVDNLRVGYYQDLASQWCLEKILNNWVASDDFPFKIDLSSESQLTVIRHKQYLAIADELVLPAKLQSLESKESGR